MNLRYLIVFIVVFGVVSEASDAYCHHVVAESGVAPVDPTTTVDVDLRLGAFSFTPRQTGYWQTVAVRGQYAFVPEFSLFLRLNWAAVEYDDGRKALGFGDMEAGFLLRLYATHHGEFIASMGVGTEWPTGDVATGIGNGHVEVVPYLIMSSHIWRGLILTSIIALRQTAGEEFSNTEASQSTDPTDPDPSDVPRRVSHGSVLGPHSASEVSLRFDAAYVFAETFYLSAGIEWIAMFDTDVEGPLTMRGEVGWKIDRHWKVSVGGEGPLLGERRADYKAGMNVTWTY